MTFCRHPAGSALSRGVSKLALVVCSGLLTATTAHAQSPASQAQVLKDIADFADRICPAVSAEGSSSSGEASAQVHAELSKLLRKAVDAGASGAAKYQSLSYKGVLQQDLKDMMKSASECRLKVFEGLKDRLLGPEPPRAHTGASSVGAGRSIAVDVSLYSASGGENPLAGGTSEYDVSYGATDSGAELSIAPRVGYLDHLAGKGAIRTANYWRSPFEENFNLPSLDFKLVNNDRRTALFTKAVFEVERSTPVDTPIPIIRLDKLGRWARTLKIINDGWGELPSLTAQFNVLPSKSGDPTDLPGSDAEVKPPYAFRVTRQWPPDEKELELDVSDALARSGADVKRITELEPVSWELDEDYEAPAEIMTALGPFRHNLAVLKGELQYASTAAQGRVQSVKFIASTWLVNARRMGAPRPPTAKYSVLLPPEGEHLSIPVSISQEVKAGDTDRFTLEVASRRSSHHRFRIRLVYNDNQSEVSPWINLEIFMPRSALQLLQAQQSRTGR